MTCLKSTKHSDKLQTVSFFQPPTFHRKSSDELSYDIRSFFYRKFTILSDFYIAQASTSMYTPYFQVYEKKLSRIHEEFLYDYVLVEESLINRFGYLPWFASTHDGYRYLTRRKFLDVYQIKNRLSVESTNLQRISWYFDETFYRYVSILFCSNEKEGERKEIKEILKCYNIFVILSLEMIIDDPLMKYVISS